MKIDELGAQLRPFEAAIDPCLLPGVWFVARLDGRNFIRLTKQDHQAKTMYCNCPGE